MPGGARFSGAPIAFGCSQETYSDKACETGEGAERLRGLKVERLEGDPQYLIRTMPAKGKRLAGLCCSSSSPLGRPGRASATHAARMSWPMSRLTEALKQDAVAGPIGGRDAIVGCGFGPWARAAIRPAARPRGLGDRRDVLEPLQRTHRLRQIHRRPAVATTTRSRSVQGSMYRSPTMRRRRARFL